MTKEKNHFKQTLYIKYEEDYILFFAGICLYMAE
jgi:hypothetical protein